MDKGLLLDGLTGDIKRVSDIINTKDEQEVEYESLENNNKPEVYHVLDKSLIKYQMEYVDPKSKVSFLRNACKLTIVNASTKYIVNYLEVEIKFYKDETLFYKTIAKIGENRDVSISPLSSYEFDFSLDSDIEYPNQPWKSEIIANVARGVPIE